MKSPDVLDPTRLRVSSADVREGGYRGDDDVLIVTVEFEYKPWWTPLSDSNIVWEKANALACVNEALRRGEVVRPW